MTTNEDILEDVEFFDEAQLGDANTHFEKALAEERASETHDFATEIFILNQLGQINLELGEYKKAEATHTEALELCKTSLEGDVSETVLMTINLLCMVFEDQEQFEKAAKVYDESIQTAAKLLGDNHPDVATTRCSQAAVCLELNQFEKAQTLYEQALPAIEEHFKEEEEAIAEIKANLAFAKEKASLPA